MTDESSDNFRLVKQAATLGTGLIEQLDQYLDEKPETRLVIVDTLQITRDPGADYSYAADYADLRAFKAFSDKRNVCTLIVHHLRKAESASDQFADISGTTGISGAVDGILVMKKEKRSSSDCCLSVTGRDVEYMEIMLRREGMRWSFVEQLTEAEAFEATIPDEVKAVVTWLAEGVCRWEGSATELIETLHIEDVTPAAFGKRLSQHHEWMRDQGVLYNMRRTGSKRLIELTLLLE